MDEIPKTTRQRGGLLFEEKWTNARAALIGFWTGLGMSSKTIARRLGGGVTEGDITKMWSEWGLPGSRSTPMIPVSLTIKQRAILTKRAEDEGIEPDEWLRRVAVAAIRDDMFNAIVDENRDED